MHVDVPTGTFGVGQILTALQNLMWRYVANFPV